MDDEDKKILAEAIADELEDSIGIATEADRNLTARVIVARMESVLLNMGWRPPATFDRIREWSARTASLPEHHVNQSVLTSHLAELSQILHDR
jgi:hypothetical protein